MDKKNQSLESTQSFSVEIHEVKITTHSHTELTDRILEFLKNLPVGAEEYYLFGTIVRVSS